MKGFTAFAVVLLFWISTPAQAQAGERVLRTTDGGVNVEVRLTKEPCTDPATRGILLGRGLAEADLNVLRAVRAWWGTKPWAGCWLEDSGAVFVLFEDGSNMPVLPSRAYTDEVL